MPLDWNWVEFILPDSAPIANFRFNSFNPYQSDWFVWQTEFGDVIRDGACSSDCSLLSGSVEVQGITDTRLPATLNGLNLDINNSSDDPLIFNVRLTTGYEDGPFHVEHMTDSIAVAPNSTTTFDLSDLSIRLDSLNDYRFKINIDLPDTGLPVENPTSLLPEYITFDINSIDMEYQYAPLRVVVNGRETAGVGSWGEYPLPYTSAKINFEDPEIFLNTVSSRFQTVDLSEYEGEAIDIFNATFDNLNGTVKVCQVTFEHDIVKEEVPFESLYVIIDGNIGVNTYWASGEADFTFSTCPQIGQQNGFEVRVEGYGPELEPDETELRARFSLAAMNASAVLPDSDFRIIATPVYTDIDSRGYPIEIADNPVNGALNVITR
jgi:hypothetical protein